MIHDSTGRQVRRGVWLASLVALWCSPSQAAHEAQVVGSATPCSTSRAQVELVQVRDAMLSWLTDIVSVTEGRTGLGETICPGAPAIDVTLVPAITIEALRDLLVPLYIASIPELDPWGSPYDFRLNVANPLSAHAIALRSAGSDGQLEGDFYDFGYSAGPEGDLVLYNGSTVRTPPRLDPVSRQLTTVRQVQQVGIALLSWYTDVASMAARPFLGPPVGPAVGMSVDLTLIAPISHAALSALLTPLYTPCVPERDGWGQLYDFRLTDELLVPPIMAIRSAGSDGITEGEVYDEEQFPADDFDRDIVWSDGLYFQQPSATRTLIFRDGFESATLWGTWSCAPDF